MIHARRCQRRCQSGGVMRRSLAFARRSAMVLGSQPKSWARPSMVRPAARRLTSSDSAHRPADDVVLIGVRSRLAMHPPLSRAMDCRLVLTPLAVDLLKCARSPRSKRPRRGAVRIPRMSRTAGRSCLSLFTPHPGRRGPGPRCSGTAQPGSRSSAPRTGTAKQPGSARRRGRGNVAAAQVSGGNIPSRPAGLHGVPEVPNALI